MRTNDEGRALIQSFEALRLVSYRDAVGVWTVGWGHTKNVTRNMTITRFEAEEFFREDLEESENAVWNALRGASVTENQFSALVSLCYNIGPTAFQGSTVLRLARAGQHRQAADAFLAWNKGRVDGKLVELPGLTRRRYAEAALYLKGLEPCASSGSPPVSSRGSSPAVPPIPAVP